MRIRNMDNRDLYKEQAKKHELNPSSTMPDEIIREKETAEIINAVSYCKPKVIMDLGCGNGHTLSVIRACEFYRNTPLIGVDYTPEMIELCKMRQLPGTEFHVGSATDLGRVKLSRRPDFIYTQRCLQNILDEDKQLDSLREIWEILEDNGHLFLIECFNEGFENYNDAREEVGLEKAKSPEQNRYFDKDKFKRKIDGLFKIKEKPERFNPYFLSNHYFVKMVLHPLLDKNWTRNGHLLRFLSEKMDDTPSSVNYSPIEGLLLKKIG